MLLLAVSATVNIKDREPSAALPIHTWPHRKCKSGGNIQPGATFADSLNLLDADWGFSLLKRSIKRPNSPSGLGIILATLRVTFERRSFTGFAQNMFPYWSTNNVGCPFIVNLSFSESSPGDSTGDSV